jgi:hypothetical protein
MWASSIATIIMIVQYMVVIEFLAYVLDDKKTMMPTFF